MTPNRATTLQYMIKWEQGFDIISIVILYSNSIHDCFYYYRLLLVWSDSAVCVCVTTGGMDQTQQRERAE